MRRIGVWPVLVSVVVAGCGGRASTSGSGGRSSTTGTGGTGPTTGTGGGAGPSDPGAEVTLAPARPIVTALGTPVDWQRRTTLPLPAVWPFKYQGDAAVLDDARGAVLKFGGYDFGNTQRTQAELWSFDLATGAWMLLGDERSPSPWPSARCTPFVYDPRRNLTVLAGTLAACTPSSTSQISTSEMWEWNGATWRTLPNSSTATVTGATGMTFDRATGNLIVVVGHQIWSFDPADGRQTQLAKSLPLPYNLLGLRIVKDEARGTYLLWTSPDSIRTVGEWDPAKNTFTPLIDTITLTNGMIWDDFVYVASSGVFLTVAGSATYELEPATNTWTTRPPATHTEEQPRTNWLDKLLVYDRAKDTVILIEQGINNILEVWQRSGS